MLKLSLGPLLYYWPAESTQAFYQQLEDWPIDLVYLGETVCARRRDLRLDDWVAIGQRLQAAGKEVILSTQTLIESEGDLKQLAKLIHRAGELGWLVEANDQSALQLLIEAEQPFVTGPSLNIYNLRSLEKLVNLGLKRWCYPLELSRETLVDFQRSLVQTVSNSNSEHNRQLETEVFAFGHLPLAWSSRCFSARFHDLPKDRCGFVCQQYPDGLMMRSQEAQDVFVLNGIQTLSGARCNLLDQLPLMQQEAVSIVRLSPQAQDMKSVVMAFDEARRNLQAGLSSTIMQIPLHSAQECNGYWFGRPGMDHINIDLE